MLTNSGYYDKIFKEGGSRMMCFTSDLKNDDESKVYIVGQNEFKKLEKNKRVDNHDGISRQDSCKSNRVRFFKNVFFNRYMICIIIFVCIVGCVYGVRAYAQYIYSCYINDRLSCEQTISKLNILDRFVDTKWMREKCEKLENSRKAYRDGCNYYDNLE